MSYIGNQPTQVAFLTDSFNGDGTTTAFSLSASPANPASIIVVVHGLTQDPTTYSVTGNTLNFTGAPPAGTANISVRYMGIPASGVTTTAYRTLTEFTATAGQTTFTPPSYTVGFISVFRNGVRLGSTDFTATNGTTIVLASAATAGDLIATESFYVSSVLNAIPNTAGAVQQTNFALGVAGTGPSFSAYKTTTQGITADVFTKITFDTEEFDTASCFSSNTFTPNVPGYYQVNAAIDLYPSSGNLSQASIVLYKNGSGYYLSQHYLTTGEFNAKLSMVVYLNGSTDYLEIYGRATGTSPQVWGSSTYRVSNFSAALIRSA